MITRYLYRNPQMIAIIMLAVLAAGVSCLYVMPRLEDPVLKRRVGVVSVKQIGGSATEIEASVVIPIEQWLSEFSEIKTVRSNTRTNITHVVIELADQVSDPPAIWSSIENKLRASASELPSQCSEPELTVFPLKAYAAILALVPSESSGNDPPVAEYRLAKELEKRLLRIEGTEAVEIFGSAAEELRVELTPQMLASTGLSTGMIASEIAEMTTVSAGNLHQNGQSLGIGLRNESDLLKQIKDIPITIPATGSRSRLEELADVSFQTRQPMSEMALIDGKQAIVVGAMVSNDQRVDLWTQNCLQSLQQLTHDFPGDYEAKPIFLQSEQITLRMDNLLGNLAISTVAVVSIVFLFLGWRCMLVVAMTLPLSASLVVCGLRFLEIPIHQMSVTGLIVSLGLLIDNAIVMVEEVRARIYEGKSPTDAIAESTQHLGLPLLGSTLTTILTFLPIATMAGPSGEFVGSLAVSVILAISVSLLLSFTIVPPLVTLLGVDSRRGNLLEYGIRLGSLANAYRRSLEITFRIPILGVLLGAALPIAGFFVAGQLQKQFFPATDRSQIQIELDMPSSSDLDSVQRCVTSARKIIDSEGTTRGQYWFLGRSAPTFYYNVVPRRRSTPNYAQAFIDLESGQSIDAVVNRIQAALDAEILDARVIVRKLEQGPPFDAPIEIRIIGDNLQLLEETGNGVRELIASHPSVTHTRADLGDKAIRLALDVDSTLTSEIGQTQSQISKQLFVNVEGADAGSFHKGAEQIPVRVTVNFQNRSVVDSLLAMPITADQSRQSTPGPRNASASPITKVDNSIALGSLGDFKLAADPGAIIRHDGQRVNEIKAYIQAGVLPSHVLSQIKARLENSNLRLSGDTRIEIGGEAEKRSAAISTLAANLVLIISLMIITLVAVLGSLRFAFIIVSVAGLVIGLGPLSLFVFGYPFGFMAIVGVMGLVGVAINDSIVVLAGIREDLGSGEEKSVFERTPEGLSFVIFKRTRHILATSATTLIGFMPLVLAGGKFWPPLAIVISAGVAGATLLALYFTPALYLLLHPQEIRLTTDSTNGETT